MLKRKLRLELWPGEEMPVCFCGKRMDKYGDHVLSCCRHCKTPMHNKIRDGLMRILGEVLMTVKLISSKVDIEKEPRRIIRALPNTRPFDLAIVFDPLLEAAAWRTHLYKLGIDVTVITSKPLVPSSDLPTQVARENEIKLRLQWGEKRRPGRFSPAFFVSK